jgi:hypothetical protein
MTAANGTEFEEIDEEERATLRELIESGQVTQISDAMREFIEDEMPDLVPKLPPRLAN